MQYGSKEKIAAEKMLRNANAAKFAAAYAKALEAGNAAGNAATPRAMIVTEPSASNPLVPRAMWHVSEGACGFAWVNVSPGNSAFANWLKKHKLASKAYHGGVDIWISAFGQSVERKESCARAMAETLRAELADSGLRIYSGSRLD